MTNATPKPFHPRQTTSNAYAVIVHHDSIHIAFNLLNQ